MSRPIDLLIESQGYIKDAQLAEYLEGKNLTPSTLWTDRAAVEIRSRYEDARRRQTEQRLRDNDDTRRAYNLKRKK